ncbi:MAG: sigma-54 dependent transcriptional regulator [Bacteroidales bacterium]|nr:sigma-54 dependent transcriptional regulator [Bacteroidales bacterium]
MKIFVVEDSEWYNKLLVYTLSLNPDYEIRSFLTGTDFLKALGEKPDIVTLDYRLPDTTGLELLLKIKSSDPDIQVILISEQDDIEMAVKLLKEGAIDYITKTNDIKERLLNTIRNIASGIDLRREVTSLRKEVQKRYSFRKSIQGESPAIKRVFELIEKACSTNITVSISGETGTGKELVAKAIHYNSPRRENQFVAVNVAAIPSELIESELFGHEKGAFTGALTRRKGKFEEADGGTLFLDEIGEMDPGMQVKLLRALQEKEIVRIGSNKPVRTDCRIIVATNKVLKEEVKKGRFREDLYYRILGLPVELPPLRDRGNDIMILARHFIESFCKENDLVMKRLSEGAQKKLMEYSFPGNVRELKSLVELAVTLAGDDEIGSQDILADPEAEAQGPPAGDLTMKEYELRIIRASIKKHGGDIRKAAAGLDIGVSTIYRILKESEG